MRFAIILPLFFITSGLFAQGSLGKMEGVGIFKIGKTDTSVIEQLKKELKTGVSKIVSMDDFIAFSGHQVVYFLAEVVRDTTTLANRCFYSSYPANCKVYVLSKYKYNGVAFEHVNLVFRDGILIEFRSDGSSRIERFLSAVYGMPEVKTNEHTVSYKKPGETVVSDCPAKSTVSIWQNDRLKARLDVEEACTLPYPTYIYFQVGNEQLVKEVQEAQKIIARQIGNRNPAIR